MLTTLFSRLFDSSTRDKEQLMERPTGIHDLPTELLLYIFRLSFDITSLQQDRCRLILVCQYWRDIVQESAYLWTEVSAHDDIYYAERSLAKSENLPIDIYYVQSDGPIPRTSFHSCYNKIIIPQLSRCRSISLIAPAYTVIKFAPLFVGLQIKPAQRLESLILKGCPSHRDSIVTGANAPQLPDMSAFPKLRRLEIDGIPCKLSSRGLGLHNVLSLNLVDVVDVSAEQLLDVLRNSPYLESLELGRSPVACPAHTASTPIHLHHLMTLHLIFMPTHVSNFFLSTLHAPNCSELFISSHFPELPDDVVRDCLFTSSTSHFTPVLRALVSRARYKDIDITRPGTGKIEFLLQFHEEDCYYYVVRRAILRLKFELHSVRQIEETVLWLGDYLQYDGPKTSIRLLMGGFEDVHLMNLLDSHTTITHLGFQAPSGPDAIMPNPILAHMAQPTHLGWPLPNLEVFIYGVAQEAESQDEAMLDMLRRRYVPTSEESDNERMRPRPIKRVKIGDDEVRSAYLLGEVQKFLPQVEASVGLGDDGSYW